MTSDAASSRIRVPSRSGFGTIFRTMAPRSRALPAKRADDARTIRPIFSALTRREALMKCGLSLMIGTLIGGLIAQAAPAQDLMTLRYGQNAAGVSGLSSLPLNVAQ